MQKHIKPQKKQRKTGRHQRQTLCLGMDHSELLEKLQQSERIQLGISDLRGFTAIVAW